MEPNLNLQQKDSVLTISQQKEVIAPIVKEIFEEILENKEAASSNSYISFLRWKEKITQTKTLARLSMI
ncbi:MAG: hypothetical protein AB1394_05840 [Bacteroidota bacterium]